MIPLPWLALLLPSVAAVPSTFIPRYPQDSRHGLRAGPDGTWEVSSGPRSSTLQYRSDGQLVGLGPAWEAPLPGEGQWAVAEGGGNRATLDAVGLTVTGAARCTLPFPTHTMPKVTGKAPSTFPLPPPEGPVSVAVDATRAVLVEKDGALLVDLTRCAPIATTSLDGWTSSAPVAIVGDELVAVSGTTLLTFHHLRLPDLGRLADVRVSAFGLLDAAGGPALLMTSGLVSAGGWRAFDSLFQPRTHNNLAYTLDLDGRVARWDGAGRLVDQSAPGAVSGLKLGGSATGDVIVDRDGAKLVLPAVGEPGWVAENVGDGWQARRGSHIGGVRIPYSGGTAAVSPDGRVLVTAAAGELVAWRLADATRLWSLKGPSGEVTTGDTWIAVGSASDGWTLVDPAFGARLGTLDCTGVFTAAQAEAVYSPALVHGHPWPASPPPEIRAAPEPPTLADTPRPARPGCSDPVATLAPLAPYPRLFNLARLELLGCAPPAGPVAPKGPNATSSAAEGASWAWTAPGPVQGMADLGEGRVVWWTAGWAGALDNNGALIWARPAPTRETAVVDGILVLSGDTRSTGVDARTGAMLWDRAAKAVYRGELRLSWVEDPADQIAFDLRTGQARHVPRPANGAAFGFSCTAQVCATTYARRWRQDAEVDGVGARTNQEGEVVLTRDGVEFATLPGLSSPVPATQGFLAYREGATRTRVFVPLDGRNIRELGPMGVAVASPTRAWLATGAVIVAHGAAPPAAQAAPSITFRERAPVTAQIAVPPEAAVRPLPAVEPWSPRVDGPRLVDSIDGAVLWRGDTKAWTAPDRWRLGIAGDMAIVRDPLGAVEGRALADGRVKWRATLSDAAVRAGGLYVKVPWTQKEIDDAEARSGVRGGVVGGAAQRHSEHLLDERSGRPVGVWSYLSGCVYPGGKRYCLVSVDNTWTLIDPGGAKIGVLSGADLLAVERFGDVVVAQTERAIQAFREGAVLWTVSNPPRGGLRANEGMLVLVGDQEARFADPATGRLIDIVPLEQ